MRWLAVAERHGLTVDAPFVLRFDDGESITAEVRLEGYGPDKGMLLASDLSVIEGRTDEITAMGYGYACLGQPSADEIDSGEGVGELLAEWGRNDAAGWSPECSDTLQKELTLKTHPLLQNNRVSSAAASLRDHSEWFEKMQQKVAKYVDRQQTLREE